MARKESETPRIESREFRSPEEIDAATAKLRRRLDELKKLDVAAAYLNNTGAEEVVIDNVRATLREVFGANSPEFHDHGSLSFWHLAGVSYDRATTARELQKGQTRVIAIVNGLIGRLEEKRSDLSSDSNGARAPSTYFDRLNLHPRIREVSRDLFLDGHAWEAVFAASKALINYVKERSGRHELDGMPLVQTVFSKNNPLLMFNDLADKTDFDEQEGMMHLFEGAVQAIRNPGGHSFPEGPEQRAIEYISFLSLLAYRLQDAKRRK
jgi:uncharacterized protein (TIGR02391 family)